MERERESERETEKGVGSEGRQSIDFGSSGASEQVKHGYQQLEQKRERKRGAATRLIITVRLVRIVIATTVNDTVAA